jgi:ubiquitin carboxyl-terminal hydrolase L3
MGLLHCVLNGHHALPPPATSALPPLVPSGPSPLSTLRSRSLPLPPDLRARLIPFTSPHSPLIESLHTTAALQGATRPPPLGADPGHAFIAFVRDRDGQVWEMDGCRKGPRRVEGCVLREGEDLLSQRVLAAEGGPGGYLAREAGWGTEREGKESKEEGRVGMEFSCTVLAPRE